MYLAKNYTDVYNEEGFEGLFKDLTGIDTRLIDWMFKGEELSYSEIFGYSTDSLGGILQRIPEVTRFIERLSSDIPAVMHTLVKYNYLTEEESVIVQDEYMNILFHLQQIEKILKEGAEKPDDLILVILEVVSNFEEMKDSFDTINENTKTLQEQFQLGVDAHQLKTVLKGLAVNSDICYETREGNFDMIIIKKVDGKDIKINISSALRIYTEGLSVLESKQRVLSEIKSQYELKYVGSYQSRRIRMMKRIREMEETPYLYQDLKEHFPSYPRSFYNITKVVVHEEMPNELTEDITNIFESIFGFIEGVIAKERELVEKVKETIESLFEEDKRISDTIFDRKG